MIEQLIREERKTPVAGKSDVLVVGGGQAAGTAAALALDQGKKSLRELDIAPLQRALVRARHNRGS